MYSVWSCWPCRIAEIVSLRYGQGNCLDLCPTDGYISTIRPEWYPHLQITSIYAQIFELDLAKIKTNMLNNITMYPDPPVESVSPFTTFNHQPVDAPHTIFVTRATAPKTSPTPVPLTKTYVTYIAEPEKKVWFWPAALLLLLQGIYQNVAEIYDQPEFWISTYNILVEHFGYVLFPIIIICTFLTCILLIAGPLYFCHHVSSKRSKNLDTLPALMWPDISEGVPLESIRFEGEDDGVSRKELEAAKKELAEAVLRKKDSDATYITEKEALQNKLDTTRKELSEAGLRKEDHDATMLREKEALQNELDAARKELSEAGLRKEGHHATLLREKEALQKALEIAQDEITKTKIQKKADEARHKQEKGTLEYDLEDVRKELSAAEIREVEQGEQLEEQGEQLEASKNATSTVQSKLDQVLRRITELEDQVKLVTGDKQALQSQVSNAEHEAKEVRDAHHAEIASLKTQHQTSYKDLETVHQSDLHDLKTKYESQRNAAAEKMNVYEEEIQELKTAHEQELDGMYSEEQLDAHLDKHTKDYEIEIKSHKTQLVLKDEAHKGEIDSLKSYFGTETQGLVAFYEDLIKKEKENCDSQLTEKQAVFEADFDREMRKGIAHYEGVITAGKQDHAAQLSEKQAAHEIEITGLKEAHEKQLKLQEANHQAELSKMSDYHQSEIDLLLQNNDIPLFLDQVADDDDDWVDKALAVAEADFPTVAPGDQTDSEEIPQTEEDLPSPLPSVSPTPAVPCLKPAVLAPYGILVEMDDTSVLSLDSTEIVGTRNGAILVKYDPHRNQKDLQPSNYRRMGTRVMQTKNDMRRSARDRLGMEEIPVMDADGNKVVDYEYRKKPDFPEGRRRRLSITCGDLDVALLEKVAWRFPSRKGFPPKSKWEFPLSSEDLMRMPRMTGSEFKEEVELREVMVKEANTPTELQRGYTDKYFAVKASPTSGLACSDCLGLTSKATLTDVLAVDDTRQQQAEWGRGEAFYGILHGFEMDKTRSTWSKQGPGDSHTCMEVRVAAIDKLNAQKLHETKAGETTATTGEPLPFPPRSTPARSSPVVVSSIPGLQIPTAPRAMLAQQPMGLNGQPRAGNAGAQPTVAPMRAPPPPTMQGPFNPAFSMPPWSLEVPQAEEEVVDTPRGPSNPGRFGMVGGRGDSYRGRGSSGGRGGFGGRRY